MPAVPGAMSAHLLLLERAGELHAVPGESTVRVPRAALDGARRLAEVSWEPSAETLLASGENARSVLASLRHRAAMGTGAELLGVADRLITMTAAYAVDRIQFGVPIGSFQAVKHHLANALIRLEFARPPSTSPPGPSTTPTRTPVATRRWPRPRLGGRPGAARMALQVHGPSATPGSTTSTSG